MGFELNKNFLLELEFRNRIIKLLLESDMIPDNLFEKLKFNTTEEYLGIAKNYFILIKEFRFVKDSEIKIKHISLKKLLFNADFKDRVIDTLNYNIKRFYPYFLYVKNIGMLHACWSPGCRLDIRRVVWFFLPSYTKKFIPF